MNIVHDQLFVFKTMCGMYIVRVYPISSVMVCVSFQKEADLKCLKLKSNELIQSTKSLLEKVNKVVGKVSLVSVDLFNVGLFDCVLKQLRSISLMTIID